MLVNLRIDVEKILTPPYLRRFSSSMQKKPVVPFFRKEYAREQLSYRKPLHEGSFKGPGLIQDPMQIDLVLHLLQSNIAKTSRKD